MPPRFIGNCADGLNAAGLINPPGSDKGITRVVIEKPIGHDLASAIALNTDIAEHFDESQIFRIDHYLGKETVENLMVLRFANAIFEPIWTAHFIDHVQITVAEHEGVGTRAAYYDQAGALRDMVQSHILQVLCMIAMEPPRSTAADAVRDAKLDVLRSLRPLKARTSLACVVRGQYGAGRSRTASRSRPIGDEEHIRAELDYRDLRRAQMLYRELAMGRSAFLSAHRQAAAQARERDRDLLQGRAAHSLQRRGRRRRCAQRADDSDSARRRACAEYHLETARLAAAAAPGQGRFPLRKRIARSLRDPAARRDAGDQTLFMRRDTVEAAWRWIQIDP